MTRLGIITGLEAEARLFAAARPSNGNIVRGAGPGAVRAYGAARAVLDEGVGALVSAGLAGGLDPALSAGSLVLADFVVAPDGTRWAADARWREAFSARLQENGLAATLGALAGVDRPLRETREKAALFAATGAVAADMESHGVARAAKEAGVPFLAVRAISDPADRALPRFVDKALMPDGRLRLARALVALGSEPWEIGSMFALARGSRRALAALRRVAPLLGLDLLESLLDV